MKRKPAAVLGLGYSYSLGALLTLASPHGAGGTFVVARKPRRSADYYNTLAAFSEFRHAKAFALVMGDTDAVVIARKRVVMRVSQGSEDPINGGTE